MNIGAIAFTDQGMDLGRRIQERLKEHAVTLTDGRQEKLKAWAQAGFEKNDALVFIGAAGIAVRAIAPFVKAKWVDPAVVVMDEGGRFAIPILSGHIGGANRLARELGERLGATPVVTTATDVSGVFAIDQWAAAQGMTVGNPQFIKGVSSRMLKGEEIVLYGDCPIKEPLPKGLALGQGEGDVYIGPFVCQDKLHIIPKTCVLGIGCRRGAALERIEAAFCQIRKKVDERAIGRISTIDMKAQEPGLLQFGEKYGLPVSAYAAEELAEAEGEFTPSPFVKEITGVDNVCERSAALCAKGPVILKKIALNGVTMAVAQELQEVRFEQ